MQCAWKFRASRAELVAKRIRRLIGGIGVEAPLDFVAPGAARQAVDHLDRLFQRLYQVALPACTVLGQDQDAPVVPPDFSNAVRAILPEGRQPWAHALPDPVDEPPRLGVGQAAARLRYRLHLIDEGPLVSRELQRVLPA